MNPFTRPDFKKRIITVSVTECQDGAFESMKKHHGAETDGALIKIALADLWDRTMREAMEKQK